MTKTSPVKLLATEASVSRRIRLVSALTMLLGSFFLLTIIGLINPPEIQAHPRYGFTPQPPPKPTSPAPTGNDSGQDEDDDDQPAPHSVSIQIEGCNLSCSTGAALASASVTQNNILARIAGPEQTLPMASALYTPSSYELLAHVQLIHEGSGWIAEGIISDAKAVSFAVPYPGQWQVFLIETPEFVSDGPLDLAGTNIEALQTSLSQAPLFLGVVEANTSEPQQVACPLNCPPANYTPAPAPAPAPAALPETGGAKPYAPLLSFIGSGLLWAMAFLSYRLYRAGRPAAAIAIAVRTDCPPEETASKQSDI